MAWSTLSFNSSALKRPEKIEVLIPQDGFKGLRQKDDFNVLFVLHGLHKDRKEWLLDSQLPFLSRELPLLVVMPTCRNAFYINTENGYNYMDYITKELPALIKELFPVSTDPRKWTVMGESMGGYGSLVCGLHHPEVFGKIVSFSGAVDLIKAGQSFTDVVWEDLAGNENKARVRGYDLFSLADRLLEVQPIWMCCGRDDTLLDMNRRFYEKVKDRWKVCYSEGEGGHDFLYWNPKLKEVLPWILGREEAEA
ncbi:MAG: esterase family protein [Lachnospiraceae bacterium]|nr:esterase family protein [Lachnospiraceae bacterium]